MSGNKANAYRNGFTLLEVMVALSVFSLAALSLVRLQALSVRSGSELSDHQMLWQVARNRSAEILTDPVAPTLGDTQGEESNGGQTFKWQQIVKRTDDVRIVRIDVIVTRPANGKKAIIRLARPVAL